MWITKVFTPVRHNFWTSHNHLKWNTQPWFDKPQGMRLPLPVSMKSAFPIFFQKHPLAKNVDWTKAPTMLVVVFTLIQPSAGPTCYILLALTEIGGAKLEQPPNRAARSQENSEFSCWLLFIYNYCLWVSLTLFYSYSDLAVTTFNAKELRLWHKKLQKIEKKL